jgi:hypothetical protein
MGGWLYMCYNKKCDDIIFDESSPIQSACKEPYDEKSLKLFQV